MSIITQIQHKTLESLEALFQRVFSTADFQINQTKPEFTGDYSIVLFSLVKTLKLPPDEIGTALGNRLLKDNPDLFTNFELIKGFLNLSISDSFWIKLLDDQFSNIQYGYAEPNHKKVMVEYSSPNTNKPLHIGHLRNNFLGWSVSEILKANGYSVIKSCIVNDRGIHICKSMIAWQKFSGGSTPESTQTKGDHFVGDYYVKFNDEYKLQVEGLIASGLSKELAEKQAPIMLETQQMLLDWEAGKPEVIELWKRMNAWVYEGFDVTYKTIGSDFDITYYESNTYLLGKKIVQEGLQKNVFVQDPDGSVWIDLTHDGFDRKIVQRKDGTSVYMTQDIGLAKQKYEQYGIDKSIYVIGDEQNYHMSVLKLICQKLQLPYSDQIEHLSYGMVELPSGKMKSREGTVVDADDLIDEMLKTSEQHTAELGKVKDFSDEELKELYRIIGLGAMKFYLLRVDPKKKMLFNPEESIDFHGFTGPFIQYSYARLKSILRKEPTIDLTLQDDSLLKLEKNILLILEQYPSIIKNAGDESNPSILANYLFNLAKNFNSFYSEHSIVRAESESKKQLRLKLATMTANVLKSGMHLLGAQVPEKM